ncbi:hypothetical protein K7X08_037500 [Anisodus acutangulus]|uniref:Methenyltetrahydrofolate cyclohydrolase n=1 Tax=Anisodus acutangulus TaxID=402998 RepID=A0A9Q1MXX6_9SOLA|nr:hypothetical protein K7X08_037500 [Anisodus acutangulus]
MREEDSNWFAKWEEESPSRNELIPLSQTLIRPNLAIAFDIQNPNIPNPKFHHPTAPQEYRHFGSLPNGQFEVPLLSQQSQQHIQRMGTSVHSSSTVLPSYVENLVSANGRKVLTLFPNGDDWFPGLRLTTSLVLPRRPGGNSTGPSTTITRSNEPISRLRFQDFYTMASPSDHKANIIDGKAIAQTIRSEIASEVGLLSEKYGKVPGLAVVIVGNRKDSQSYVNMKRKSCAELGIKSFDIDLPEDVAEAEVISKVHELNANPDVHGILVQLPLPKHINEERVLGEISLEKDVDGFHPLNIGKLAMKGRQPLFLPCTPKGCIELLVRNGISIKGKNAVVVGRSNIVGLPVSLLLLKEDATVTVVHSCTKEPEKIIREADIIIAAAGKAMMIKGTWIKPGAAVIDVGTNAVDDPTRKSGYRLVGDVDFQEACKVAGWITPVPGGVGPMTVAMLLKNTLDGAKRVIEK